MAEKQIPDAARKYYPEHAGEVTMSSKRQITIPAKVARDLGLEPGVKLAVYVEGDEITLIPKKMGWLEYVTSGPPIYTQNRTREEVDEYIREVREGWDRRARLAEGDSHRGFDDTD